MMLSFLGLSGAEFLECFFLPTMPFRFIFGGRGNRKQPQHQSLDLSEIDINSEVEYMTDEGFYDNAINDVYFTNPGFGEAISPSPSVRQMRRQYTRTISSRMREYRRATSRNPSECEVDVSLAPTAFSMHNIPSGLRGNSFCSRDDSEIATRTMMNGTPENGRSSSCMMNPHVNALYLHDMPSCDDSVVGSCTIEKIPLRRMGSAMSYRLSVTGTPDFSVYGEDDASMLSRPGHFRSQSGMSDTIAGVQERNKLVRLESIVGGMQKSEDSVFEFGVISLDRFGNPEMQATPRLCKSRSEQLQPCRSFTSEVDTGKPLSNEGGCIGSQLSSYPLFLTNILEEDEDEEEDEDAVNLVVEDAECEIAAKVEKAVKVEDAVDDDADAQSENTFVSLEEEKEGRDVIHSSYQVCLAPIDVKPGEGFTNPAFELETESEHTESPFDQERQPVLRLQSMKKNRTKEKQSADFDVRPKARREKRDENLHVALLERYLVQTVVDKYFVD